MPRPHTQAERALIRQRLIDVGRDGFSRAGLAKVSIADLARQAGIGKGSFYQFFPSKEELFLTIQEQEEERFKELLGRELDSASCGPDAVVVLITAAATRFDAHPILKLLLDPATLSTLTLRVSPERLTAHRDDDRRYFVELFRSWQRRGWMRPDVSPETAFHTLAAVFLLSTQRPLLGADATLDAVREIARALATSWCPRASVERN